jgi:hypothetical protein
MVVGKVVGGKNTTTENQYILNTKGSVELNKKALKQVLYQEGFTKVIENKDFIQFQKQGAIMNELIFSKTKETTINADFTVENINLEILQHGNYNFSADSKINQTFKKIEQLFNNL